jgi:hypothetical protein
MSFVSLLFTIPETLPVGVAVLSPSEKLFAYFGELHTHIPSPTELFTP